MKSGSWLVAVLEYLECQTVYLRRMEAKEERMEECFLRIEIDYGKVQIRYMLGLTYVTIQTI